MTDAALPHGVAAHAHPAYRIDDRPATAQAFYAAACDPQRSVVVEACAGAGKTWMLVSRILRALLAGAEPQQILAITFTRKAAAEMRERLADWLAGLSAARCDAATRVQALCDRGLDARAAQALEPALAQLHEQLLRGGRGVELRTFHGWFTQLLAAAPLALLQRLALPLRYEPIEDNAVLRPALMRALHARIDADPALRADYVALVARHRRSTVLQWLDAAWQRGPELARADAAGNAAAAVPDAATQFPQCRGLADPAELLLRAPLADAVDELALQLGASGRAKAAIAADGLRAALQTPQAGEALRLAWGALVTKDGDPRKQLGDAPLLQQVLEALRALRGMQLQQQAHDDHAAMLRLARVLLAEYAALKRRRGLVDMADLERAADVMLGDSELAAWVQERLDQRLRHVLVDEFQDTSPLQWQALHGWLQSYAGAGGGASGQRPPAIFIVGDPKQSIYRFRGAEPRVFAAARDFVVQGLAGQLLQCDHTRRSAPAVVAALNAVFADAARADGWGPFRAHTTSAPGQVASPLSSIPAGDGQREAASLGPCGDASHVLRLPGALRPPKGTAGSASSVDPSVWRDSLTEPRSQPELRLRAEEAAQVAAAASALIARHGLAPGEIMVLARTRAVLALVAQALARAGVPHAVAEALALHEAPEALDLAAVLDVLASPGHDIALARALKSPLVGAADADLLWLAQQAAGQRPWLAALLGAAALPTPALQRAQRLFADWAAAAPQRTPHELLDRIVDQGDLLARLSAAVPAARRGVALQAVHALLAAALGHRGGRFASIYGFVRALRAGQLQASVVAPADAVQLLTVHGAKGLEARAVIVVDADPEPRQPERATLLVDWPVELPAPRGVAFLRSESAIPPSLVATWADEDAARAREELNGLYVAMTRAREWLVFSRTEPSRRGAALSWWARAEALTQPWLPQPAEPAQAVAAEQTVEVATLPRLTWRAPLLAPVSVRDAAAARLGQAVHRVLEWAGRPGATWSPAEHAGASAAAAAAFGLRADAARRVAQIAARVLASPECARFFSGPALQWAGNEVPVAWAGEALRIDRLVALRDGATTTWWVLDYKLQASAAQLPEQRVQVRRYVAAVQALQPSDAVRGALIDADGALIEV